MLLKVNFETLQFVYKKFANINDST